jgi:hypothetical protein
MIQIPSSASPMLERGVALTEQERIFALSEDAGPAALDFNAVIGRAGVLVLAIANGVVLQGGARSLKPLISRSRK